MERRGRTNYPTGHVSIVVAACAAALALAALLAGEALAYSRYDDGTGKGCVECHSGFKMGPQGALHMAHVSSFGITNCNFCHPSGGGSAPVRTYTSGPGGGFGCAGCHGQMYGETSPLSGVMKASGYGLRAVHAANGVTVCANCHAPGKLGHTDPPPARLGEDSLPPYYGMIGSELTDTCSSAQEDSAYDDDGVGLDNDGDGATDWPGDADCPVPTTTSTTTTTTMAPAVECGVAPATGCIGASKGKLQVSEKTIGKEKLKIGMGAFASAVDAGDLGDPVSGRTSYAVCIYDAADALVGEMAVLEAGQACGSAQPCWSAAGSGFKYGDKAAAADGVAKLQLAGASAGKGKITIGAKNDEDNGMTSMPVGIAYRLQGDTGATVQLLTDDGACFEMKTSQVKVADGVQFTATLP